MTETRTIYCCGCKAKVEARLTNGAEIYPHRWDLASLPFWRCDTCRNYVGCHHKTAEPTYPLGNIPDPEMRVARGHIHRILDPIWKNKKMSRRKIYQLISDKIGWRYHTALIKTIDEARTIYKIIKEISCDTQKTNSSPN